MNTIWRWKWHHLELLCLSGRCDPRIARKFCLYWIWYEDENGTICHCLSSPGRLDPRKNVVLLSTVWRWKLHDLLCFCRSGRFVPGTKNLIDAKYCLCWIQYEDENGTITRCFAHQADVILEKKSYRRKILSFLTTIWRQKWHHLLLLLLIRQIQY